MAILKVLGSSTISRKLRRQRLKGHLIIALILLVTLIVWYTQSYSYNVNSNYLANPDLLDDSLSFSSENKGATQDYEEINNSSTESLMNEHHYASEVSPFRIAFKQIETKIKTQSKRFSFFQLFRKIETSEVSHYWNKLNSTEQCKHLIKGFYKIPNWSTEDILKEYENNSVGSLVFTLMVERLRVYDYCFIHGNENLKELINNEDFDGITSQDFNTRMFPFMNFQNSESELIWPTVYDLSKSNGITNAVVQPPHIEDIDTFNANFWQNWAKYSNGKGIVVTMRSSDTLMFYRQLKVLKALGNVLPIQVITTGGEVSEQFIKDLSDYSKQLEQKIYLVDVSNILDKQFVLTHIHNFYNKWIAQLFNTFEEALFIDIDAVPYIPLEEFFNIDSYQKSGILMYRDRSLIDEHTFRRCTDLIHEVEPSIEEVIMTNRKLMFDANWSKRNQLVQDNELPSVEALIYRNFFEKLQLHHVDSGLIVFNKALKLNGILMSFLSNLDFRLRTCVYGDKETSWLGELIAGETYSIDPMEGGILGPVNSEEHEGANKYSICGSQIGHVDKNERLLWSNGGLRTCKFYDTAVSEFAADEEYFISRYKTPEILQRIYDSPLVIDGVIIPDPKNNPWLQIKECANYMYCAFATRGKFDTNNNSGRLIEFENDKKVMYKNISELWNTIDIDVFENLLVEST